MATVRTTTADLTTMEIDVVVNAANEHLAHGGGVAAAMSRAGGPSVQTESDEWVADNGPVGDGQAAVTTAGDMPATWIVHVVGPRYRGDGSDASKLAAAVDAALDASLGLGAATVALPAISTGIFGYPLDDATKVIVTACRSWIADHPTTDLEIVLVGVHDRATSAFDTALADTSDITPRD